MLALLTGTESTWDHGRASTLAARDAKRARPANGDVLPAATSSTLARMSLQDRVDELAAQQGSTEEDRLLHTQIVRYERHGTAHPGVNETYYVVLDDGHEAFHKPFTGVAVPTAQHYGHHPDEVPMHECGAWRLAHRLGPAYAEIVAPCVLRAHEGEAGALSARQFGLPLTDEPLTRVPDRARAAAFFDSLIAQQDRHAGNYRWDGNAEKLGLIDHGFAFARPGQYVNQSFFVAWRWARDEQALIDAEQQALRNLLESRDLHGLGRFLLPEEAEALAARADLMLERSSILAVGEF